MKNVRKMLTLLASFAQEESRSISENARWAIQKRFEQGIPNGKFRIYGYRWEDDRLVPVPEEAAIVRRIFQNFLDGKSRLETEREFAAEGITTRDGCRWVDSNIKVVLSNVTYTGNLLLQKEFIEDPLTKKRRKNKGQLLQYYVENTHECCPYVNTMHPLRKPVKWVFLGICALHTPHRRWQKVSLQASFEWVFAIWGGAFFSTFLIEPRVQ